MTIPCARARSTCPCHSPITNVFRADQPSPGLSRDDALAGAPASEEDRFLVPKILGEEA